MLQAAANGSVGSGTLGNTASSYAIASSAIFEMESKKDVVKTVHMERDTLANALYDERRGGEKNDGMYMRAQAESKVSKSDEKSQRERSMKGVERLLGKAAVPAALKEYHGQNGVTEKGHKKKMNGITDEGLAGDPSADDFPEEDRKAFTDAVSKLLVKDEVVQVGEVLCKGKDMRSDACCAFASLTGEASVDEMRMKSGSEMGLPSSFAFASLRGEASVDEMRIKSGSAMGLPSSFTLGSCLDSSRFWWQSSSKWLTSGSTCCGMPLARSLPAAALISAPRWPPPAPRRAFMPLLGTWFAPEPDPPPKSMSCSESCSLASTMGRFFGDEHG